MNLRDALQSIYDDHGKLTPAIVVDEARPPKSPLHSRFEWDNTLAGESWRRQQARELIGSVRVVYREARGRQGPRSIRAYHSVQTGDGPSYEPAELIATDPMMRALLLAEMEREWKQLRDRWSHFKEFAEMVAADLSDVA